MANPYDQFDANPYDAFDQPQQRSVLDEAKRQVGLLGRSTLNAAAALPMAALEGGAGIANYIRNGAYTDAQEIAPPDKQNFSFRKQWDEGLDKIGLPRPEAPVEKVTDFATQLLVGSKFPAPGIENPAPASFRSPADMRTLMRADQVRKAQEAGYVIPPATGNQSMPAKGLEGLAGKLAVGQLASARNMSNTDRLAARALNMSEDAPLTLAGVQEVRKEAWPAYEAVRGAGTLSLGKPWFDTLDKAQAAIKGANKSFPGFAKSDASERLTALRQNFVDSSDAVDAIRVLRDYADEAGTARNFKLARTYRNLATELENRIERHLVANGQTGLVDNFRQARQMIAKTYSVEKAMNKGTGGVSATKLGRQLDHGAPLSGELRDIGQFALSFPKAAREFNESLPGVSPLDAYAAGGGAALGAAFSGGSPAALLPLAYPFVRMGLQRGLLTPFGQQLAMPAVRQGLSPQSVMGGTYGLLSLGQQ